MGTGSPLILGRLLKGVNPNNYSILTNRKEKFLSDKKTLEWLRCSYYFIGDNNRYNYKTIIQKNPLKRKKSLAEIDGLIDVYFLVMHFRKIKQEEKITHILVTSDNGTFLIAGLLISILYKVPLFIYFFDIYADNALSYFNKIIAKMIEPKLIKKAHKIFVTNESTEHFLEKKYPFSKNKYIVLHHPTSEIKLNNRSTIQVKPMKTIVYAGALYWAQLPCLEDLAKACLDVGIKLHILGKASNEQKSNFNKYGVVVKYVTHAEALRYQQEADMLFLPMSFNPISKAIVKTASPGKVAEYLTLGKPILVYAPSYSYIAQYAKKEGFACVVDRKNHQTLCKALIRIKTDNSYRKQLRFNAKQTVKNNHNILKIKNLFTKTLSI